MVTFSKFIFEKNEFDITYAIEKNKKLLNLAMRTNNAESLKKTMVKIKSEFQSIDIDFEKVDWKIVFIDLNENTKG